MGWDDDDWVGEPPEGRHSRERADPGFWRRHVPVSVGGVLIVIVAVVVILLSAVPAGAANARPATVPALQELRAAGGAP